MHSNIRSKLATLASFAQSKTKLITFVSLSVGMWLPPTHTKKHSKSAFVTDAVSAKVAYNNRTQASIGHF